MDYTFAQSQFFQWQRLIIFLIVVYIFVQSEEEYCLIWKAKLLTIQTDKGKW